MSHNRTLSSRDTGESSTFLDIKPSRKISSSVANSSFSEPIFVDSDDDDDAPFPVESSNFTYGRGNPGMAEHYVNGDSAGHNGGQEMDMDAKDAIRVALRKLDVEIKDVTAQLKPLQALHATLTAERRQLESQLSSRPNLPSSSTSMARKGHSSTAVNYQSSSFPFTPAILQTLKSTFHLDSFRLCQEGVVNAAMDGRDIVCVMPTGGGKSLTYQLPAVMGRGLTVVISPLLALIWDQVRALKEIGVECVMLTGATSTSEQNDIYRRMEAGPSRQGKEIRLCYVTPEKVAKSKRFSSVLEKVHQADRLRRFVIDEAHCCSQLGHDFRPDYKKLSMLKTLFPRVPIQAVTATLSQKTLPDLLKILRLPPITDGSAANTTGTVFFSAPLFRPNLHYKVLSKPSNAKSAIAAMGKWIQENHPDQSGIIYCFSKKDAETVAEQLLEWSNGAIKTGVYHAGVDDADKERIHVRWRQGKVNCICATIAFGLGIDKGDVRYVLHHSLSKSLEGYYQETGRAGRDGQDSDCILFYRAQDAARLSSLVYSDVDGISKLHEMLRFAEDLNTCRKVAFAKYFSASAHLSASAWDHADSLSSSSGTISTCGICDNCLRSSDSIITRDITLEAWKILRISQSVEREGGRVTLANLADLVRGLGGGSFGIVANEGKKGRKRRLGDDKGQIDMEEVGGKVTLNKDDTERLLMHLILLGYLRDSYAATAYSINVYVVSSDKAIRLTRLSLEQVEAAGGRGNSGIGVKVECTFPAPPEKKSKVKGTKKGKGKGKVEDDSEEDDDEVENGDEDEDEDKPGGNRKKGKAKRKSLEKEKSPTKRKKKSRITIEDENDNEDDPELEMELEAMRWADESDEWDEDESLGENWIKEDGWVVRNSNPVVGVKSKVDLVGKAKGKKAGASVLDDLYD